MFERYNKITSLNFRPDLIDKMTTTYVPPSASCSSFSLEHDFISRECSEKYIGKLSLTKLEELETIYNEFLDKEFMCSYFAHLLQVLNTRDKITCRINKLKRDNNARHHKILLRRQRIELLFN